MGLVKRFREQDFCQVRGGLSRRKGMDAPRFTGTWIARGTTPNEKMTPVDIRMKAQTVRRHRE
jgi:hypothetical protein